MKNLTEQNLNKDDISFLRSNISYVTRNIHEGFLETVKDTAINLGKHIARETLKSIPAGLESHAAEVAKNTAEIETRRTADGLGMNPSDLVKWRSRAKDFIDPTTGHMTPPQHPGPNATYEQKEEWKSNMKDFMAARGVMRDTATLYARSPEQRQAVDAQQLPLRQNAETLAGRGVMGGILGWANRKIQDLS